MTNPTALNQHPWPTGTRRGWMPGDIDVATLSHAFGPAEIGVIKELMAKIRAAGTPLYDVKPEQFRHPLLDAFMLPLVDELKQGPGLVLITGFDELGDDIDDWRLAYWGIGTYFGNQVSQSVRGDLMGDVKVKPNSIGGRLYSTPASARLHSDRIDMLTLLCVQKAKKGGESGFASSFAIRDIVARERPDVLKLMERGFRQSRNNEQPAGEPGITPYHVPVFAEKDGVQSCLLSGNCSIAHQRASVKDELSDVEIEALEYFMSVLERPEIRITVPLQRGEAVFMNNYEVLHSRDAFEDDEDPGKKRHLLRMWIEGRPPRPRVAEQTVVVNRSGRQGIDPQPEKVAADGSIIS